MAAGAGADPGDSKVVLAAVVRRLGPVLRRLERRARFRYWPSSDRLLTRLVGAFVLVLSIPVLLPVPLSNLMPGFGIAFLGIGLTARDGLWLAAGFLAGGLALTVLTALYAAAMMALSLSYEVFAPAK